MENSEEFMIRLGCVRDVEDFVAMSTAKSFPIFLDDGRHRVNGKSFMEMFCLVITRPLRLIAECTPEEFAQLCQEAERFRYQ